ncbi:sugar transferase [Candidatus Parcubacteria bacterium]|nr:sugar transferase [Candidatus Parcubacteria bacterium]
MRKFLLLIFDIALLYISLAATLIIRYDSDLALRYYTHLAPFTIIFILWLAIFYIANLYDPRTFRNSIHFYSAISQSIIIATVISISFFYLIPIFGITPKTNLLIFIAIFSGLDILVRSMFNSVVETKFHKSTLMVGNSDQAKELAEFIQRNPQLGYQLKSIVDASVPLKELEEEIKEKHINTIVIGPEAYQRSSIIDLLYRSLNRSITFYSLPMLYEQLTGRVPLGAINQIWFLENLSEGNKKVYEGLKRIADMILGSVFGALSLIAYPFIVAAMQLDSRGPIFHRQTRIGHLGKSFQIVKFRTMIPDAEAKTGAVWAADNDTRVTRIGRFLRKTRLDEIPQFWTIVSGAMSLVGPRAERPEFHEKLKEHIPFYEERYLIKPGLSGWAQINYPYGASVQDAAEKLQYDLYYIKNRSFLLDFGIVLKTIRISLQQSGK